MVVNGHSWSSIQEYTLSEIGIFFVTIVQLEREDKTEQLYYLWMGSNVSHDGIKEVQEKLKISNQEEPDATVSEWRRLASFMHGVK